MRAAIVSLLLSSALAQSPAQAQTPAQVDVQLKAALVEFEAGRPAEAMKLLDAAEAASTEWPDYQTQILFFKARCFVALHQPKAALEALERYVAEATEADDRKDGRAWIAKVRRRFFGSARVTCADASLRVRLEAPDARPQRCPAQWDYLVPGRYTVSVAERSFSIEVKAGETVTVDPERPEQAKNEPLPALDEVAGDKPAVAFTLGAFARAGTSLVTGKVATAVDVSPSIAAALGARADLNWGGAYTLGFELGYAYWSLDTAAPAADATVTAHAVRLAVLSSFEVVDTLSLVIGPGVDVMLAVDADGQSVEHAPLAALLHTGTAWRLPTEFPLSIDLRYQVELNQAMTSSGLRRHAVMLGASVELY